MEEDKNKVLAAFKASQEKKVLLPEAYEVIKRICGEVVDRAKEYSPEEKDYAKAYALTECVKWWTKAADGKGDVETGEAIERLFNILAVNSTLRAWQYYNLASKPGQTYQIEPNQKND